MESDEFPTLKGEPGVLDYCHKNGVRGVGKHTVHTAVIERKLIPHQIGGANWFSIRDIESWLRSFRQTGPTRFVGANVGRAPESPAAVAE